jgi:exodeoxyribonuclease V gamma subunit
MLYCIYANDLRLLKQVVARTIQTRALTDPFQAEQIVVPGTSLSQWLKLELASELGMAANIDYPMPANFLWRLFRILIEELPIESDFNKEIMTWHVLAILPELLADERFLPLRQYLDKSSPLHAFQLAGKIADVFDQYLVYRIDWINDWSGGGNMAADSHPWQPVLWRALCERITALGRRPLHRAHLFLRFIESLQHEGDSAEKLKRTLPDRLFIFGFSSLPPMYLRALESLGKYCDIYLLVSNPCRYFWSDEGLAPLPVSFFPANSADILTEDAQQNTAFVEGKTQSLLASLGKQGRDFLSQLQDVAAQESDYYIEPGRGTLLASVQQDILDCVDRSASLFAASDSQIKQALSEQDFSISFHSHYSPLREVEVLHDHLLHLFEQDSALTPRDIVVMVPAIDRYSPYIHAVFANAGLMPFSVADRSARNEEPLLLWVQTLLQLPASRLTVSDVLALLELPAIRRRFQINESELPLITRWIRDSGIRWGLDGAHRRDLNLSDFEENSWRFGLKRMLAGYSLGEHHLFQGIASYDEVGGLPAQCVGKLGSLLDQLEQTRVSLAVEHTVDEWISLTHALIEDYFHFEPGEELALLPLRTALEHFKKQTALAEYQQPIPHGVFVYFIKNALDDTAGNASFLTGKISFCTLLPKRAIPFKVICLLGMNEGDYPLIQPSLGFDLMAEFYRPGDRARRDEERFLFLEALLAAEKKLYLSWLGRSIQDNSEKQASLLINELLDFCLNNYCLAGDETLKPDESATKLRRFLITQHPLQAFSVENFQHDTAAPLRFSYAHGWVPPAPSQLYKTNPFSKSNSTSKTSLPENTTATDEIISIDALQAFFRNPCRYFFRHHLQVKLEIDADQLDENEPFTISTLIDYQLKQSVLKQHIQHTHGEHFEQFQLASGYLPAGYAGRFLLTQADIQLSALTSALDGLPRRNASSSVEIDLLLGSQRVQGWLQNEFIHQYVVTRVNEPKGKDYLCSWIYHLLLCATNPPDFQGTLLLGVKKSKSSPSQLVTIRYGVLERDTALIYLNDLFALFLDGRRRPLPFFPQTSWVWYEKFASAEGDPKKINDAFQSAQKTFYADEFSSDSIRNEGVDPSVSRIFPCLDDIADDFKHNATRVYAPLMLHMQVEAQA